MESVKGVIGKCCSRRVEQHSSVSSYINYASFGSPRKTDVDKKNEERHDGTSSEYNISTGCSTGMSPNHKQGMSPNSPSSRAKMDGKVCDRGRGSEGMNEGMMSEQSVSESSHSNLEAQLKSDLKTSLICGVDGYAIGYGNSSLLGIDIGGMGDQSSPSRHRLGTPPSNASPCLSPSRKANNPNLTNNPNWGGTYFDSNRKNGSTGQNGVKQTSISTTNNTISTTSSNSSCDVRGSYHGAPVIIRSPTSGSQGATGIAMSCVSLEDFRNSGNEESSSTIIRGLPIQQYYDNLKIPEISGVGFGREKEALLASSPLLEKDQYSPKSLEQGSLEQQVLLSKARQSPDRVVGVFDPGFLCRVVEEEVDDVHEIDDRTPNKIIAGNQLVTIQERETQSINEKNGAQDDEQNDTQDDTHDDEGMSSSSSASVDEGLQIKNV